MNGTRTIGIAGTGLIGASIGLRARELGWRVLGFDADAGACERARELGALNECVSREELYESCDIVVLAMHTNGTLREIEALRARPGIRASLVIDVASVKAPVSAAAHGVPHFIATHPMAGAEKSGPEAARATLFCERPWLYVPSPDASLNARATKFLAALGARPVPVDAAEHDACVALTSHLPQVLGTLFSARVRARGESKLEPYCGPVARELLRLGNSSAEMWYDILNANGANIAAELRALARAMISTADSLEEASLKRASS